MAKCEGAKWCVLVPEPGREICKWHRELPVLSSYEDKDDWIRRRNRIAAARKREIAKALAADKKLEKRMGRS